MDEQIRNQISCKCGAKAILLMDNKWKCGNCVNKFLHCKHNKNIFKRIWGAIKNG